MTILRTESSLFFADADRVREAIRAAAGTAGTRAVVLDLGTVPDVDLTASKMLAETRAELAARGIRLVYARDVGQVRDVLGMEGATGQDYPSIPPALEAIAADASDTMTTEVRP